MNFKGNNTRLRSNRLSQPIMEHKKSYSHMPTTTLQSVSKKQPLIKVNSVDETAIRLVTPSPPPTTNLGVPKNNSNFDNANGKYINIKK